MTLAGCKTCPTGRRRHEPHSIVVGEDSHPARASPPSPLGGTCHQRREPRKYPEGVTHSQPGVARLAGLPRVTPNIIRINPEGVAPAHHGRAAPLWNPFRVHLTRAGGNPGYPGMRRGTLGFECETLSASFPAKFSGWPGLDQREAPARVSESVSVELGVCDARVS